jgi:hypothetical protein
MGQPCGHHARCWHHLTMIFHSFDQQLVVANEHDMISSELLLHLPFAREANRTLGCVIGDVESV